MLPKAVGKVVISKKRWCGRDRSKEALVALPQSQEKEGMPQEGTPAPAHADFGLVFMEFSQFQTSLTLTGKCTGEFLHPERMHPAALKGGPCQQVFFQDIWWCWVGAWI